MGLELGSPEKESVSCLLWTENLSSDRGRQDHPCGPRLPESASERACPSARWSWLGVEGFDEDNAYDRHKDLDFLRYDLDLKGFMMRAVSQYMREWCRISSDALSQGVLRQAPGVFAHESLSRRGPM